MSIFITGTDTGCGKTYVSALLIKALAEQGYQVAGMKPIATGATRVRSKLIHEDDEILARASNVVLKPRRRNPYIFLPACSPHIASKEANEPIELDKIVEAYRSCKADSEHLVVEGVGGWRAPLNLAETVEDLAIRLDIPVLLVVGVKLGALNHALLTAEAIERSGSKMVGWIANILDPLMYRSLENVAYLEEKINSPLLMKLSHDETEEENFEAMRNFAKNFSKVTV
jgi:dethiobiotin synthetase